MFYRFLSIWSANNSKSIASAQETGATALCVCVCASNFVIETKRILCKCNNFSNAFSGDLHGSVRGSHTFEE